MSLIFKLNNNINVRENCIKNIISYNLYIHVSVLYRHVERFWGASGDLWQGWWKKIHALFGGDEFLLSIIGRFS